MLFSRAPRLLWRSFKYLVYIAPWASARGAFTFQSGPYARGVQVSSGLRPHARGGFQVFSSFCAPMRMRTRGSTFLVIPASHSRRKLRRLNQYSRGVVPIWDDSRAAFTSTCRVATNCRNSSMATEGLLPMMRCASPMRQIVASVHHSPFYRCLLCGQLALRPLQGN